MNRLLTTTATLALLVLAGCKNAQSTNQAGGQAPSPGVALLPAADPALAPLGFMAGSWVGVNPNKSVNREQWTSPAGKTMTGAFNQMRANGSPTLYEFSILVAEAEGVMLYHRHLHLKLVIDDRRKDVNVFKLQSVEGGRAVFVPASNNSDGIDTMVYRADGPNGLVQEVNFKPGSKEKSFATSYQRAER